MPSTSTPSGSLRLLDRLVVDREVEVHVLAESALAVVGVVAVWAWAVHATQPVLDDVRDLEGVSRVVGHHAGVGRGE
jgi:hypothetical protein